MANGPIISVSPLQTANQPKKKKATLGVGDPGFINQQLQQVVGQQLTGAIPGTAQQAGQLARIAETRRREGGAITAQIPGRAGTGIALAQGRAIETGIAQTQADFLAQQAQQRLGVQQAGVQSALQIQAQTELQRQAQAAETFRTRQLEEVSLPAVEREQRRLDLQEKQQQFNNNFSVLKLNENARQTTINNLSNLIASGTLSPEQEKAARNNSLELATGKISTGYFDENLQWIPNPEFQKIEIGDPDGLTQLEALAEANVGKGWEPGTKGPFFDQQGNEITPMQAWIQEGVDPLTMGADDYALIQAQITDFFTLDQARKALLGDTGGTDKVEFTGPTGTDDDGNPIFVEGNTRKNPETGNKETFRNGAFEEEKISPEGTVRIGEIDVPLLATDPRVSGAVGDAFVRGESQIVNGQPVIFTSPTEFVPIVNGGVAEGGNAMISAAPGLLPTLIDMTANVNKFFSDPTITDREVAAERIWTPEGFRDATIDEKLANFTGTDDQPQVIDVNDFEGQNELNQAWQFVKKDKSLRETEALEFAKQGFNWSESDLRLLPPSILESMDNGLNTASNPAYIGKPTSTSFKSGDTVEIGGRTLNIGDFIFLDGSVKFTIRDVDVPGDESLNFFKTYEKGLYRIGTVSEEQFTRGKTIPINVTSLEPISNTVKTPTGTPISDVEGIIAGAKEISKEAGDAVKDAFKKLFGQ